MVNAVTTQLRIPSPIINNPLFPLITESTWNLKSSSLSNIFRSLSTTMEGCREEINVVPILEIDQLKVVSPVGRGAKGVVFLVKDDQSGESWALKVISRELVEKKKDIKDGSEYKRIYLEQQVLSRLKHPLLPRLHGVLATDKVVGYAIDYCPGLNLHNLRKQQSEKMFSADIIRFYAAELVLALEYLHNLGIAYRDLKPENIMIQESGHVMLVDFDLSTKLSPISRETSPNHIPLSQEKSARRRRFSSPLNRLCNAGLLPDDSYEQGFNSTISESKPGEKSKSFVGTEEYVSPEVIQGHGHEFAVDWWSLGVVLYEMLYGVTPFRGGNRKETFFRILTKEPELVGEATPLKDLIRKMLVKDPRQRIKLEEIKGHEFFKGIDWNLLLEIGRPPYIPPNEEEEGKDGNKEIDVESFVKEIFGENGKKEKNEEEEEEEKVKRKVWVNGLDSNHPCQNKNFAVF